jgi:hypothetical protein
VAEMKRRLCCLQEDFSVGRMGIWETREEAVFGGLVGWWGDSNPCQA